MMLPPNWKCEFGQESECWFIGVLRLRDDAERSRITGPYKTAEEGWTHIRGLAEEDNIRWDWAFLVPITGAALINCSDYGDGKRWARLVLDKALCPACHLPLAACSCPNPPRHPEARQDPTRYAEHVKNGAGWKDPAKGYGGAK